ncbi:DUF4917 family protein [Paenibacillus pinisoli]|uniref:DUF4917 family protein n=1 Tax=Paenibacillus pinisoli TaxID=1276110 RepID=A0A3A6PRZ7_9BACL|nr:DUF4917 family protein [Paenibacillus pinisoli]RJX41039.1 DUF4917 family protein [Paenibacillus pinisoli]
MTILQPQVGHETLELLTNVLIGNGFSIGISSQFNYSSLVELCDLNIIDKKLFEELETSNFEFVMKTLVNADKLDKIYNRTDSTFLHAYGRIKRSLIEAIGKIHPEKYEIDLSDNYVLNKTMVRHSKRIFSTNYDMLLYWMILEDKKHVDFFGRSHNKDGTLRFTPNRESEKQVFHLHGALHLYLNDGYIEKLNTSDHLANHSSIVELIKEMIELGRMPLFISEGNGEEKKKSILNNEYLNFCYKSLEDLEGSITVFGHSLDNEVDSHIIHALNNAKKLSRVNYCIYTEGKSEPVIQLEMSRITYLFSGKEVVFYDSESIRNNMRVIEFYV